MGVLDLSYDLPAGVYLNGSAFGALADRAHTGLVWITGDVGYARQLNLQLSVDGGVTHSEYVDLGKSRYNTGYTEIYGGLASHHLSARLSYSPDYFLSGARTLYGEVAGNIGLAAGVRLNVHLGSLEYLDRPAGLAPARTQYDWLIGGSRQFGAFDVRMGVSGGGPRQSYGYDLPRAQTEVVVGAGYTF